ncbi:MAG TPA: serine/threonine-protein kinase, partial [Pseudonocardiaceae bacterium]|nr:serine/threonine-protein kinase [Pseudonocardiaceae bacterium]
MTADARLIADRYRLEQQIGAGAMGVVWRAHDIRLDRTVAVKQLLMQPGLGKAETEAATARAMREGRIAARLQHPHAISVYDVALDDIEDSAAVGSLAQAVPWLVMEYLPSRSLAAVLAERGTLPPREVAKIGRQIAAALAAAHRAGIVHSDVKPGNVLLGVDGIVKITDFGISRASWEAAVTRTGVVAGTPAYFAPEVARGEPRNPAADVFSLGSTLYTAVEGEPPFGLNDNTLALLRTVAEGQVRPPQQAGPLSALLMKMLRADPAARPSMTDAVVALGAVAHGGSRTRGARRPLITPKPTAVDLPAIPAQETRSAPARPRTVQAPLHAVAAHGRMPDSGADDPLQRDPLLTDPMRTDSVPIDSVRQDDPLQQTPLLGAAAADRNRRRRGGMILFGAATMCLAAVLVTVLALSSRERPVAQAPDSSAIATSPPVAAPPPPAPGPGELVQAVRTYYSLLPENTTAAWELLGGPERAKAGSLADYADFWNGIDEVRLRDVPQVQGNTVLVNLQFDPKDRRRTLERYQLTMDTAPNGRIVIDSSVLIDSIATGDDRGGRGNQSGRGNDDIGGDNGGDD